MRTLSVFCKIKNVLEGACVFQKQLVKLVQCGALKQEPLCNRLEIVTNSCEMLGGGFGSSVSGYPWFLTQIS